MHGHYYIAHVKTSEIWLIIAHIKSNDALAFHRTMEGANDRMEFFVPPAHAERFERYLDAYIRTGVIYSYERHENRLIENAA